MQKFNYSAESTTGWFPLRLHFEIPYSRMLCASSAAHELEEAQRQHRQVGIGTYNQTKCKSLTWPYHTSQTTKHTDTSWEIKLNVTLASCVIQEWKRHNFEPEIINLFICFLCRVSYWNIQTKYGILLWITVLDAFEYIIFPDKSLIYVIVKYARRCHELEK